jgi:hypothetical protein
MLSKAMMDSKIKEFLERFPFMSLVRYGETELVGIIQNSDQTVVTMYVYNLLKDGDDKTLFIECGEEWWWGSNRLIPINIVLKAPMRTFLYALKTYSSKDFEVLHGNLTSLTNVITKRTKRRQISLIRKLD